MHGAQGQPESDGVASKGLEEEEGSLRVKVRPPACPALHGCISRGFPSIDPTTNFLVSAQFLPPVPLPWGEGKE